MEMRYAYLFALAVIMMAISQSGGNAPTSDAQTAAAVQTGNVVAPATR